MAAGAAGNLAPHVAREAVRLLDRGHARGNSRGTPHGAAIDAEVAMRRKVTDTRGTQSVHSPHRASRRAIELDWLPTNATLVRDLQPPASALTSS